MNIAVTPRAREELLRIGLRDAGVLRLSVQPGGCAGMQYSAEIVDRQEEDDRVVFDQDGVKIATSPRHELYLDGLKIDFSDDLIRPGFVLTNAKAKSSCGCGASFGAKQGGCGA